MTVEELQEQLDDALQRIEVRGHLIEDALDVAHRSNALVTVFSCGFHAFTGDGLRLAVSILDDLDSAVITPPVTQDQIWQRAREMEIEPEWPPYFRSEIGKNP